MDNVVDMRTDAERAAAREAIRAMRDDLAAAPKLPNPFVAVAVDDDVAQPERELSDASA